MSKWEMEDVEILEHMFKIKKHLSNASYAFYSNIVYDKEEFTTTIIPALKKQVGSD